MYSRLLLVFALASGTALAQATSLPAQQESHRRCILNVQTVQRQFEKRRRIILPCKSVVLVTWIFQLRIKRDR